MDSRHSDDLTERYGRDGIVTPLPAVGEAESAQLFELYQKYPAASGKFAGGVPRKPHLLLSWLNELIRHPRILDPVERLLGPDIFCWTTGFFSKKPGDGKYVSWHQDATYWGLSTPDVVTAWVAFTPSTVESGCMRVIPGSHLVNQLPHRDTDTYGNGNLLTRGQEVAVEVDEGKALDVVLAPGQMSLHHVMIVHGSGPNRSNHPRIGYAIRYVAAHVSQTSGVRDSATLVRGTDKFGNFEHEPAPRYDLDPAAVAYHDALADRIKKILFRGTKLG